MDLTNNRTFYCHLSVRKKARWEGLCHLPVISRCYADALRSLAHSLLQAVYRDEINNHNNKGSLGYVKAGDLLKITLLPVVFLPFLCVHMLDWMGTSPSMGWYKLSNFQWHHLVLVGKTSALSWLVCRIWLVSGDISVSLLCHKNVRLHLAPPGPILGNGMTSLHFSFSPPYIPFFRVIMLNENTKLM